MSLFWRMWHALSDDSHGPTHCQYNADGQGAYAALDAVAGPGFPEVLASVRKSGLVISYGILSSSQITLDVMPLLRQACLPVLSWCFPIFP